ncbi:uncharacterized protein BcabD6B2_52920 [Babesia caballi]|uniref:Uncharacterized protein n=1 Tax=Babesia caballi TaxID=5871 RepID=A0AAV4M040_BABCB|nr:hypothetical protein BcabD6B2_52920 [Babesia caballi]
MGALLGEADEADAVLRHVEDGLGNLKHDAVDEVLASEVAGLHGLDLVGEGIVLYGPGARVGEQTGQLVDRGQSGVDGQNVVGRHAPLHVGHQLGQLGVKCVGRHDHGQQHANHGLELARLGVGAVERAQQLVAVALLQALDGAVVHLGAGQHEPNTGELAGQSVDALLAGDEQKVLQSHDALRLGVLDVHVLAHDAADVLDDGGALLGGVGALDGAELAEGASAVQQKVVLGTLQVNHALHLGHAGQVADHANHGNALGGGVAGHDCGLHGGLGELGAAVEVGALDPRADALHDLLGHAGGEDGGTQAGNFGEPGDGGDLAVGAVGVLLGGLERTTQVLHGAAHVLLSGKQLEHLEGGGRDGLVLLVLEHQLEQRVDDGDVAGLQVLQRVGSAGEGQQQADGLEAVLVTAVVGLHGGREALQPAVLVDHRKILDVARKAVQHVKDVEVDGQVLKVVLAAGAQNLHDLVGEERGLQLALLRGGGDKGHEGKGHLLLVGHLVEDGQGDSHGVGLDEGLGAGLEQLGQGVGNAGNTGCIVHAGLQSSDQVVHSALLHHLLAVGAVRSHGAQDTRGAGDHVHHHVAVALQLRRGVLDQVDDQAQSAVLGQLLADGGNVRQRPQSVHGGLVLRRAGLALLDVVQTLLEGSRAHD